MKKIFIVLLLMALIVPFAYGAKSKYYVLFDKSNGEIKGGAEIDDQDTLDWSQQYNLMEVDDTFRGKQPWEMRYKNGKLRLATDQELSVYKTEQREKNKQLQIDNALEVLGLTAEDLENIKKLKE